jgi:hypothetical protein
MIGTIVLRHPRVPWWMIGLSTTVQLSTLIMTKLTRAEWQRQLGEMSYVRMPNGSINPVYEQIVDTHWIRIALVFAYAAVVLAMMVTVGMRRRPLPSRSAPILIATVHPPTDIQIATGRTG